MLVPQNFNQDPVIIDTSNQEPEEDSSEEAGEVEEEKKHGCKRGHGKCGKKMGGLPPRKAMKRLIHKELEA